MTSATAAVAGCDVGQGVRGALRRVLAMISSSGIFWSQRWVAAGTKWRSWCGQATHTLARVTKGKVTDK